MVFPLIASFLSDRDTEKNQKQIQFFPFALCPGLIPALHCTVLYCTVLYCTVLHCTALIDCILLIKMIRPCGVAAALREIKEKVEEYYRLMMQSAVQCPVM